MVRTDPNPVQKTGSNKGKYIFFIYFLFLIFLGVELLSTMDFREQYTEPLFKLSKAYMGFYDVNGTTMANEKSTQNFDKNTKSEYVNPHNYNYIIVEKDMCKQIDSVDVYLIVVVCVSPARFEHRETIRNTWGSVVKTDRQVRLIFMLGKVDDTNVQGKVNQESQTFHDIVQEDFVDSYRNLTLKSVAMLKWVSTYCKQAPYLLKVDDDMFVNIAYLLNVLKHKNLKNSVIGTQINGAHPIRDTRSKWYTPVEIFSKTVYPVYLSGTSYALSTDLVSQLYLASLEIPFFWLEDVYITGLCRTKIKANIVNDWGFTYSKPTPSGCTFRKRITGHQYSLDEIRKIWSQLNDKSVICR